MTICPSESRQRAPRRSGRRRWIRTCSLDLSFYPSDSFCNIPFYQHLSVSNLSSIQQFKLDSTFPNYRKQLSVAKQKSDQCYGSGLESVLSRKFVLKLNQFKILDVTFSLRNNTHAWLIYKRCTFIAREFQVMQAILKRIKQEKVKNM